jgi:3-isopropylmalate/(R)-2-methylmalate dehydratase large subunit
MAGKTISEQILSAKSGRDARAGDVVVCRVDFAMGTDGSVPMALDYFAAMAGTRVHAPDRIAFALDHYAPPESAAALALHARIREFAAGQGIRLWDVGEGIGHQLIIEHGLAPPGSLVLGADSHAVTYGATGAFGAGIGSSDLAAILVTGEIWLRVPPTIRVALRGRMPAGVYAKDVALALAGELGADGANYRALEFAGERWELDARLVLSNLSVEMGAKNAVWPLGGLAADRDAVYEREVEIVLDELTPRVALPHRVDSVRALRDAAGTPVRMVYLGTCTGGRASDFHQALAVLRAGGGPAAGVQLVVTPASRAVLEELSADGSLAEFAAYGATFGMPGCGSCCGTCGTIPADGVNVISTANRNFQGRMGNALASIYLASPASCAAAAVRGAIEDPREFLE